MKKTLIALLALSGVASAATLAKIDTSDANLKSYVNFSGDSFTTTAGSITYNNAPIVQDGYGIVSATDSHNTSSTENPGFKTNAFTLSFDVRSFDVGSLVSVCVDNGAAWKHIRLESTTDKALTLKFEGPSPVREVATTLTSGTRTEWTTITIVGDDSVTAGIKLYVEGSHVGSLDMTGASNWNGTNVKAFQFGSVYSPFDFPKLTGNAEIDNLLVYNRAFTAAEVKALTIPEPTTATLSLLALAGLAARRRRK
ncbi:MAG: LamG domain-containing protein [Akkermansia sp.]|nr:LamG domain-containing protein [Akkermansia sp.]